MILKKYRLSFMTNSYLTPQVLMNTNITLVTMKAGYRWKEEPENCTGIKKQFHRSLERLKKKDIELCGRSVTKINLPGRCDGNKFIYFLASFNVHN